MKEYEISSIPDTSPVCPLPISKLYCTTYIPRFLLSESPFTKAIVSLE